ncbi:formimidoylglutamate deiminase [Saxibacter everestensis]|uniref:Formimidoylglutamate deiminase n=1 Tax=Saxibacter everestensis TaxID=2909229 RepID=A0ABY8QYC1_9MICO|nr:formimidoylglutamate deiminase [Brevibacteriaceae bacterium ZFBP1038]
MTAFWCEHAWLPSGGRSGVRVVSDAQGRIAAIEDSARPEPADTVLEGVTFPGFANTHSHLFHRFLRGRTHSEGGTFWTWRNQMYQLAGGITPESYQTMARAVFAEMLHAGYTAVGEFHYLHHRPDGTRYPGHEMELAVVRAAAATGIRLTLLDTCYLTGGIGQPLTAEQARFGDGDAERWLNRWFALRDAVAAESGSDDGAIRLGAAIHSVRAVPEDQLRVIARELPADVPLHIHLSEQPAENEQCLAAYGVTPTQLLDRVGLLDRAITAVHATHLTVGDIELLGRSGAAISICPSTEADLADGIGPARELSDAGAAITLGSDQNAVIDPLLEARGLEAGERLRSGQRGRFRPEEIARAMTASGYSSIGWDGGTLTRGALCDLTTVRLDSARTIGSSAGQVMLTATAADVSAVIVAGKVRSTGAGDARAVEQLLTAAISPDRRGKVHAE